MVGVLQPLQSAIAIVNQAGFPTDYFIKWTQQRQEDISEGITEEQALALIVQFMNDHPLQAGSGITLTPSGDINDSPTISADVQAILDQISPTHGSVIYRGVADWVALAPGTAGYILSTNGPAADPTWIAPSSGGGAMTLIATSNPTGTTTVTFSSIPNTFNALKLIGFGRSTVAGTATTVGLRLNADTGANYSGQRIFANLTTPAADQALNQTSFLAAELPGTTSFANVAMMFEIDLFNYKSTAFAKSIRSFWTNNANVANQNSIFTIYRGGYWSNVASAINQIDLISASGNWVTGSQVRLYGIT